MVVFILNYSILFGAVVNGIIFLTSPWFVHDHMIIQHFTKNLSKFEIEGKYLDIMKSVYDRSTANIILTIERFKPSP